MNTQFKKELINCIEFMTIELTNFVFAQIRANIPRIVGGFFETAFMQRILNGMEHEEIKNSSGDFIRGMLTRLEEVVEMEVQNRFAVYRGSEISNTIEETE